MNENPLGGWEYHIAKALWLVITIAGAVAYNSFPAVRGSEDHVLSPYVLPAFPTMIVGIHVCYFSRSGRSPRRTLDAVFAILLGLAAGVLLCGWVRERDLWLANFDFLIPFGCAVLLISEWPSSHDR